VEGVLTTRRLAAVVVATAVIVSAAGVSAAGLDAGAIDAAARTMPRLHSLLVSHHGELIFERYYNRRLPSQPDNIKSASKSIISALIGVAMERGLVTDLRTPIVKYFPELARDADPGKQAITVEDLLTMRAGLEGTSNRHYGAWVTSRN
jgi:CubicO group peptidase (beta-lactamase class C family)